MDIQKQEIREAVELPLTHFDLYKQIGIDPPRGVLMYGPPGCGKTMLAKAVAHHTTASFIRVVGSEFVQKYLGEGPRMVRDVFRLAKENAPSIIFIDEIDAIATKRFDAQTGGKIIFYIDLVKSFICKIQVQKYMKFCREMESARSRCVLHCRTAESHVVLVDVLCKD